MTIWKPIDSAPRDGSYVIAARFRDGECEEVSGAAWNLYPKPGEYGLNGFNGHLDNATHWMPVPILSSIEPTPSPEPSWHADDIAVDRFAVAMKAKLAEARAKGKDGWYDETACSQEFLSGELRRHALKADPIDVANFAMFLHQRGETIAPVPSPEPQASNAGAGEELRVPLENLAREMRAMLRANPKKDGGLYRQRLTEAEEALAAPEPHGAELERARRAVQSLGALLSARPHSRSKDLPARYFEWVQRVEKDHAAIRDALDRVALAPKPKVEERT